MSIDSIHFARDIDQLLIEVARVLRPGGLFIVCTHTEWDLKRQALGVYFPSTLPIEMTAAKRIRGMPGASLRAGMQKISRSHDIKRFSPNRLYIELFARKCASVLHHIPTFDFNKGVKDLRRAAASNRRVAAHCYTSFVFQKPPRI